MSKIIILIPYFGKFPEWSDLFFETLKCNESIDFLFYTDCEIEQHKAENINYVQLSFEEYVARINAFVSIDFKPVNAYKLCDVRPLFGEIHKIDFEGYDFYGWCDMDLLFGDIRSFYTDEILAQNDVFSTHNNRISGHFALFRNNNRNRKMYLNIYNWEIHLKEPEFVGIDEHGTSNAYTMTFFDKFNEKFNSKIDNFLTRALKKRKMSRLYLKEQYTTPFSTVTWIDGSKFSNHPDTWFYKRGAVTNSRDGERKFIYIHFMNFKDSKWRHDKTKAPWEGKEKICFAETKDLDSGVKIDSAGILAIPQK